MGGKKEVDPEVVIGMVADGVARPPYLANLGTRDLARVVSALANRGRGNAAVSDDVLEEQLGRLKNPREKNKDKIRRGLAALMIVRIMGTAGDRKR